MLGPIPLNLLHHAPQKVRLCEGLQQLRQTCQTCHICISIIYIYIIYMFIYLYIYCIYLPCINVWMYGCMYAVCMYVVWMHACMHPCMDGCMYVRMYVRICMYVPCILHRYYIQSCIYRYLIRTTDLFIYLFIVGHNWWRQAPAARACGLGAEVINKLLNFSSPSSKDFSIRPP